MPRALVIGSEGNIGAPLVRRLREDGYEVLETDIRPGTGGGYLMADINHPVVRLSISPASANHFLLPVLMTANAQRMDKALLSVACISYYNPTTGKWEDLESTVSILGLTVSTPLWHFSTYRVSSEGKAGW